MRSEPVTGVSVTRIVFSEKNRVFSSVTLVFRYLLSCKIYLLSEHWCTEKAMGWIARFYNISVIDFKEITVFWEFNNIFVFNLCI